MKVYHEEKDKGLPVGRTDSKKSKLFRRKLAVKGHKSKVENRKSAPAEILLSDLTSKEYEKLENLASSFLHSDEAASSASHSSDSHDEDRLANLSDMSPPNDSERARAASASGVVALSLDESRDRGDSFDSTLNEDGVTGDIGNHQDARVDEEKSLQEDREKAIAVLKRVHPSRVMTVKHIIICAVVVIIIIVLVVIVIIKIAHHCCHHHHDHCHNHHHHDLHHHSLAVYFH